MGKTKAASKPLYDNYAMYSPGKKLMCYISKKSASWYVKKELASFLVGEELGIQLHFEPKSLGYNGEDSAEFYLNKRRNLCVVCGATTNLNKHHVVPYCYRKHFPKAYIKRSHHDILPICIDCHEKYEKAASLLKLMLDKDHDVVSGKIKESEEQVALWKCGKHAHALLKYADKVPEYRKKEIRKKIELYLGREPTQKDLEEIREAGYNYMQTRHPTYKREKIVEELGIEKLEELWRGHFLEFARPKFLPANWPPNIEVEVDLCQK